MGKKRKSEHLQEVEQKSRNRRRLLAVLAGVCALVVVVVLLARAASSAGVDRTVLLSVDDSGDLRIRRSQLRSTLTYVDYGGPEQLLVWVDGNGVARTAYDTCVECHPKGPVHYTRGGSILMCGYCGTTSALDELGRPSWGGCQPISIPAAYRMDAGREIVIPADVLEYADIMFAQWAEGDYTVSMQNFVDSI